MPAATAKNIKDWLGEHLHHEGLPVPRSATKLAAVLKSVTSATQVEKALEVANEMLNAHGIESTRGTKNLYRGGNGYFGDSVALYVNMGCPYTATLLYETATGKFLVTGWGEWVEKNERKYGLL